MTGPEHYREAERLARLAQGQNYEAAAVTLADAQVHATLALAAATVAINLPISDAVWREVAGPKPDGGA